jgi:hypothetical protein
MHFIVEKEAMDPRTFDELAHGTASGGRIRHGNPKSIGQR